MKFSYFEPAVADIAGALNISKEAVDFRVKRIHKCIAARYSKWISPRACKGGTDRDSSPC